VRRLRSVWRIALGRELQGAFARQIAIGKEDRTTIHDDRSAGQDRRVQVPFEPDRVHSVQRIVLERDVEIGEGTSIDGVKVRRAERELE